MNNIFTKFTSVGANVMVFNAARICSLVEELVRTFNRFYVANSTAELLFQFADSFSRSNWQMSNWQ